MQVHAASPLTPRVAASGSGSGSGSGGIGASPTGVGLGWVGLNQYLVVCGRTKEALVVDFVDSSPMRWAAFASRLGVRVVCVAQLEFHLDMVGHALSGQFALGDAPIAAHPKALEFFGGSSQGKHARDVALSDGSVLSVGKLRF